MSGTNLEAGTVERSTQNGICTITFAHPAHNSMPGAQLRRLQEAIDAAGEDHEAHVIILRSGGDRTFCAGASFDELLAVSNEEEGLEFFSGFARVINAMRRCPKLIIGRVQGKAVGGGVGLLAACDLVYATKFASIKLSELAIGIGPFVIGPAVRRKAGLATFSEMSIRANEFFSPQYAQQRGFYTEVFDTAADMDAAIHEKATTLAGYHLEAMQEMKRVLWRDTDHWPELLRERARISGSLITRPWSREALAKIKGK